MSEKNTGRVTIPTNLDVVPETIELMKRWGADAIRDCDGTEFPEELTKTGAKIYATYYTTRKDNEWAKANPDEVQQCYIMSGFYTAVESELQIPLMKGISDELMQVNTRDDIKRWWEVVDRSTGQVVSTKQWEYNEESGCVCIHEAEPFHEYTVSFLAYIIWDPVHMYNAVTNDWKDFEHQITFDVRQPKTHKYSICNNGGDSSCYIISFKKINTKVSNGSSAYVCGNNNNIKYANKRLGNKYFKCRGTGAPKVEHSGFFYYFDSADNNNKFICSSSNNGRNLIGRK